MSTFVHIVVWAKKEAMQNAHSLIESIRNAPANVTVLARLSGGVFAFRWVAGKLVYRPLRRA